MALARIVTLLPRLMADSSILVLIPHPNKQLGQWEMGEFLEWCRCLVGRLEIGVNLAEGWIFEWGLEYKR